MEEKYKKCSSDTLTVEYIYKKCSYMEDKDKKCSTVEDKVKKRSSDNLTVEYKDKKRSSTTKIRFSFQRQYAKLQHWFKLNPVWIEEKCMTK